MHSSASRSFPRKNRSFCVFYLAALRFISQLPSARVVHLTFISLSDCPALPLYACSASHRRAANVFLRTEGVVGARLLFPTTVLAGGVAVCAPEHSVLHLARFIGRLTTTGARGEASTRVHSRRWTGLLGVIVLCVHSENRVNPESARTCPLVSTT